MRTQSTFFFVSNKKVSNDTPIYRYVHSQINSHKKLTMVDQQEENSPYLPIAFQNFEEHV